MAQRSSQQAARDVLTNPDLVELILAHLGPETRIVAPTRSAPATRRLVDAQRPDRLAASHVNRTFREVALRGPWRATWNDERAAQPQLDITQFTGWLHDNGSVEPYFPRLPSFTDEHSAPAWTLAALLGLCRRRNVTLELFLRPGVTLASCATLLRCRPRSLVVRFGSEAVLANWLQRTPVPLDRERRGGPGSTTPVLEYLSSLNCVTSLALGPALGARYVQWVDASWLLAMPQLRQVELGGYGGAPLGALLQLRRLEGLAVRFVQVDVKGPRLKEVEVSGLASPRLTSLTLADCTLLSGASTAGCPARGWLRMLQRFELKFSGLSLEDPGLRGLMPNLTRLRLRECEGRDMVRTFSQGLPATLQELELSCALHGPPSSVWQATARLTNLVSLKVRLEAAPHGEEGVRAAIKGLSRLPKLQWVSLSLTTAHKSNLRKCFRSLQALLIRRGGALDLDPTTLNWLRGTAW